MVCRRIPSPARTLPLTATDFTPRPPTLEVLLWESERTNFERGCITKRKVRDLMGLPDKLDPSKRVALEAAQWRQEVQGGPGRAVEMVSPEGPFEIASTPAGPGLGVIIPAIVAEIGGREIGQITAADVRRLWTTFEASYGEQFAEDADAVLRRGLYAALDAGWIERHPCG